MADIGKTFPKKFNWTYVPAIKDHKKGKAKGYILMAINKEIKNIKGECYGESWGVR